MTLSPTELTHVGNRQRDELPWFEVDQDELICTVCPVTLDEEVQQKDVLWGEPIVGVEQVTLDENGPGARDATAPTTPKAPTK